MPGVDVPSYRTLLTPGRRAVAVDVALLRSQLETATQVYLVFNEGYVSSAGESLIRVDLCAEAVRLTRMVHERLPDHAETGALLALELLHDARRPARLHEGEPVPLDEQDRSLWDRALITEGTALIDSAMARGPLGPLQLQAAIAALHCSARAADDTDWLQILALYDLLIRCDPSPMVPVSRAVAVARVHGPSAGLRALDEATNSPSFVRSHRVDAVRAHLLEELGEVAGAHSAYLSAARETRSEPERRHLLSRAARLAPRPPC